MPTNFEARLAVINEVIWSTGEKLTELARTLAKLKEGDPRADQVRRQLKKLNEQRQKTFDEQKQLIEAKIADLNRKTERLRKGREKGLG